MPALPSRAATVEELLGPAELIPLPALHLPGWCSECGACAQGRTGGQWWHTHAAAGRACAGAWFVVDASVLAALQWVAARVRQETLEDGQHLDVAEAQAPARPAARG